MASIRRTVCRAMERNPRSWRTFRFKEGENRIERRRRAKKTREQQKREKTEK
ncbi:MAG: hypothetical protein J6U54_01125 [Clostridiales bacterium]|nr:hypothetical protein [Clostridiales bacterium]